MGYSVKSYTFADSNDLQTVVTAAAGECDVIYLPTDNTVASNTEIIKNVCLRGGVPIFAGEEASVRAAAWPRSPSAITTWLHDG
jgi:putative ABC transport system substrate-binding protein